MDQLTAARIQTMRDHMRLECKSDWDGVIATFVHPCYNRRAVMTAPRPDFSAARSSAFHRLERESDRLPSCRTTRSMASRNNMHEPSILLAAALATRMQGARMRIK